MTDPDTVSDLSMVFTPEYLTLPGLYSEVIDDIDDGGEDDDDDSCYCESCSGASSTRSNSAHSYELSYIYHRFISSLRITPIFRNFQVSFNSNRVNVSNFTFSFLPKCINIQKF